MAHNTKHKQIQCLVFARSLCEGLVLTSTVTIHSLYKTPYKPGVSFGQMSLNGEGLQLSFRVVGGELDGDTHIGIHLWRLAGLPWP